MPSESIHIADTLRYGAALVMLVTVPPAIVFWCLVHPFARFWRRLGAARTWAVLAVPGFAWAAASIVWRDRFLPESGDLGSRPAAFAGAGILYAVSFAIGIARSRALPSSTLSGLPELSEAAYPGTLVTSGIYAHMRHPRYVEALLGIFATAGLAHHVTAYAIALGSVPMLFLIVVLEERELRERFGEAYASYARRVPRFVPRGRPPEA